MYSKSYLVSSGIRSKVTSWFTGKYTQRYGDNGMAENVSSQHQTENKLDQLAWFITVFVFAVYIQYQILYFEAIVDLVQNGYRVWLLNEGFTIFLLQQLTGL